MTSKDEIEMWGDGKQTRSFTFIDDCVEGILRITKSDFREPLNLGSTEMVSMNGMMESIMTFEDKVGKLHYIHRMHMYCKQSLGSWQGSLQLM